MQKIYLAGNTSLLKWSVCEDVIYSYNKSKKYKLKLSGKSKAFSIYKEIVKLGFSEYFDRGLILSKVVKNFSNFTTKT